MEIKIKKLLINMSTYGDRPTGLGIYSKKCADVIAKNFSDAIFLISKVNDYKNVVSTPIGITIGYDRFAAVRRFFWGLFKVSMPNVDITYSPTHHSINCDNPQVITVHDLICLDFPAQHLFQYLYFKLILPRVLRRSLCVFTVSDYTKGRICETYNYPAERIFVVPNSIEPTLYSGPKLGDITLNQFPTNKPFILCVGARYRHKNVEEVIANYEVWGKDFNLVITSCGGKYRKSLEKLIKNLGIERSVYIYEYVDYQNLLNLYKATRCLVYPSLVEGFGIPPLESIASGTPVIVSDIAVFREVLGDSALYVVNGDQSSWKEAFSVLNNNEKMNLLKEKWPARLLSFSNSNFENKLVDALNSCRQFIEQ